ncbi:MAG: toxin TcdB middle/C-terminal domain-containing protein, partial [Gloeotrichia echinulata HAB0833]
GFRVFFIAMAKLLSIGNRGIEREFRGFGRVERQDAETLMIDAKSTDVPPVLTKTWYHTGYWQENFSLPQLYAKEYFSGDPQAALSLESTFYEVEKYTDEEIREAHVALKGTVLRTEVYGCDGPALQGNPYSVSVAGYNVKLLQPRAENKYAIFYVYGRETLSSDYERNPQDPRISHHFTMEIDEYGHVLQECMIAYGRRSPDAIPEQTGLKATYTENTFINWSENNVRLLGIPQESKTYELKNLVLPAGKDYFDFEAISTYLQRQQGETNRNLHLNLLGSERHYYGSPNQKEPLSLGEVTPQALLVRSEVAVVSQEQIESVFSGVLDKEQLDDYLTTKGKYNFDSGYWWNPGLTQSYSGSDCFYLPRATTDPFGGETQVKYDQYRLLPEKVTVKVTDTLLNETTVEVIDYHLLQPQKIRDLNDNFSEVRFDALGMVILSSHYGTENGKEVGFAKDLSQITLPEFNMEVAIANPQKYLTGAASYFYYDLFAWTQRQVPAFAVNLVAENYGSDARVQTHITYSDGFGREVQSKMRIEPGKAFAVKPDGSIEEKETTNRWLSSGGKFYNNKGNPIQEFEPYYIDTYQYVDHPTLNKFGVSSLLHYDPLQRVVRVDTPKGFFTKVEFTPWEEKHYDENDTVTDSSYYNNQNIPAAERQALVNAAKFYNTPNIKILDNLGRVVRDVGLLEDGTQLITSYELDIVGNQLSSTDPRLGAKGYKNFQTIYDLTKVALKTVSADGGTHWILHNVMGNPIYIRDSRNFETTTEYDVLHRPTQVWVKGGDGAVPLNNIVERIVYGESVANAKNLNLRGQVYQHYDSAGLVKINQYNIGGQHNDSQRRLRQEYKQEANWPIENANALLQPLLPENKNCYLTKIRYDAIGRIIEEIDAEGNIHRPIYHLSGRLAQMQVIHARDKQPTIYVENIDYNPKGQRTKIVYGNGLTTTYEYEATTFRLTRILTKRENKLLQDLNYTYDPVGNITQIEDKAWESIFNKNQKVEPVSTYTYDALYRLVKATGREHRALSGQQEQSADLPEGFFGTPQSLNNAQAVENYTRFCGGEKFSRSEVEALPLFG